MKKGESLLFNKTLQRRVYFIFVVLIILSDILGFFLMQGDSDFEHGVSIYSPKNGSVTKPQFTVDGVVYSKEGISTLEAVLLNSSNEEFKFPFTCHEVKYKEQTLLFLSSYTVQISLPADGDYRLTVYMKTKGDNVVKSVERTVHVDTVSAAPSFRMFNAGHMMTLGVMVVFAICLIIWARRGTQKRIILGKVIIACLTMSFELAIMYNLVLQRNYRISYDLPIHMCSVSILLIPVILFSENAKLKEFLYNLLFLWGLGGSMQALLTPDLSIYPFLGIHYISFFVTHGMIIVTVMYLTYVEGNRPRWRHFPKVLLATAIGSIIAFGINYLVKLLPPYEVGGYYYLAYPPVSGSAIDYLVDIFGPSPYYIFGMLLLLPIAQGILMFPIWLIDKVKGKIAKNRQ